MSEEGKGTSPGIRTRAYEFALRAVKLCRELAKDRLGSIMVSQLVRSGTAIGANREEAQAAQSKRDFTHKMYIARKEAFETRYWLRIIRDTECLPPERMSEITAESDEICRVLSATTRSSRQPKSVNS